MDIRRNTKELLGKHFEGLVRVAATGPGEASSIEESLAGDLQNNAGQTNIKRAIPEDYKYDPASLKPMAKMLWSMSVSLGHALSAHKAFVRLKSSTISPDGMLGGRGYVMAVKDVRTMLHDACEALSALCDTIHDEINAPHWQPKLGQLESADVDKIRDLLNEAQGYLDDPEEMTKEDEEEVESKDGHAGWHHPAVDKANKGKKEPRSDLPSGGDKETSPQAQPLRHDMRKSPNPQNEKQASGTGTALDPAYWLDGSTFLFAKEGQVPTLAERVAARFVRANSSLPVETMPGGPRVDHLDRGDVDQTGPFGTYDHEHGKPDDEEELSDKWRRDDGFGNDYNYPSDWANDLHEKQGFFNFNTPSPGPLRYPPEGFGDAQAAWTNSWQPWSNPTGTSAIPDSNSDKTPTEGFDFGIGDGNGDDAHGQAAGGYGEGNPGAPDTNPGGGTGNRGVYGPQSGLPKDPGGKVNPDEGDSNLTVENEIGGKGRYASDDPWAAHPPAPGTVPFGAPDFQEATREEPTREAGLIEMMLIPGTDTFVAESIATAVGLDPKTGKFADEQFPADKPWGHHDGWVMGLTPEQLVIMGKTAWYDGVYDFERPVEPVGAQAGAPLPGGPQQPYVGMFMEPDENFDYGANLPGDATPGVARTDYYDGNKPINMQNTAPSNVGSTRLPGEQMVTPPKPTTQRPSHNQEHEFATMNPLATGELPGDGQRVDYDFNMDVGPDQTTRFEQMNTPYIKWDYNTPEQRFDPLHQRDPVQGPYVHNDLTERPSNG